MPRIGDLREITNPSCEVLTVLNSCTAAGVYFLHHGRPRLLQPSDRTQERDVAATVATITTASTLHPIGNDHAKKHILLDHLINPHPIHNPFTMHKVPSPQPHRPVPQTPGSRHGKQPGRP